MHYTVILFTLYSTVTCKFDERKATEAISISNEVYAILKKIFEDCYLKNMPNLNFITDNLYNYVNEFSRTTVGLSPRFISNRKFFMNMISHPKFRNMLAADTAAMQKSMVDKMKFCDESTLNVELLKQLYDREADQTKT